MKVLITGGCGFLGSNIAEKVINEGNSLTIVDNLSRTGSEKNLIWLQTKGKFDFKQVDIRDIENITDIIKNVQPDVIYHLAGQVAMTTSLANPRLDFEINVLGTFNILEAVRQFSNQSIVIYSSTNKVYGDLEFVEFEEGPARYNAIAYPNGFNENIGLEFHSPYGVSKGSADQYCLDYARIFGLKTAVFRHSSMFGGRQFSTYDQGWIGWFCSQAILQSVDKDLAPFTISGNGKQVRDVLFSTDMVNLYTTVPKYIDKVKGNAFNIGGGIKNSLSLLELFGTLEDILQTKLRYEIIEPRISDQKFFVADLTKINSLTGWLPEVSAKAGIEHMVNWLKSQL